MCGRCVTGVSGHWGGDNPVRSTAAPAQALLQTSVPCDGPALPQGSFSVHPAITTQLLAAFPTDSAEGIEGTAVRFLTLKCPFGKKIVPFHCSATLSAQGTLAVGSTFQFSDYNTCVNVLEPGQPVCLYPTVSFVQFHCDHMGQKSPFTVSQCSLCTSLSVPCTISIEHSLLEK